MRGVGVTGRGTPPGRGRYSTGGNFYSEYASVVGSAPGGTDSTGDGSATSGGADGGGRGGGGGRRPPGGVWRLASDEAVRAGAVRAAAEEAAAGGEPAAPEAGELTDGGWGTLVPRSEK